MAAVKLEPRVCRPELESFVDTSVDGDAFIIVASDGVWEFIQSQAIEIAIEIAISVLRLSTDSSSSL